MYLYLLLIFNFLSFSCMEKILKPTNETKILHLFNTFQTQFKRTALNQNEQTNITHFSDLLFLRFWTYYIFSVLWIFFCKIRFLNNFIVKFHTLCSILFMVPENTL